MGGERDGWTAIPPVEEKPVHRKQTPSLVRGLWAHSSRALYAPWSLRYLSVAHRQFRAYPVPMKVLAFRVMVSDMVIEEKVLEGRRGAAGTEKPSRSAGERLDKTYPMSLVD